MHHIAVSNRAASTRVITCHAANRGLPSSGYIYWIPKTMLLEGAIEMVQHNTWLNFHVALIEIEIKNISEVFAVINH